MMRVTVLAIFVLGCFLSCDVQAARLRRDVTEAPEIEPELKCPEGKYGRFVIPGNCTHYLLCTPRGQRVRKCPEGLYFDPRRWCTVPERTTCPPALYAPIKDMPECPKPWGTFAFPTDCTKYFVCDENVPSIRQCPDGQFFFQGTGCMVADSCNSVQRFDVDSSNEDQSNDILSITNE